jgi:leucyl/phenylalanyl-tRNA--protein transferase
MISADSGSKVNTLDPKLLLAAYAAGIFPMADEKSGEIHWYSPDPRGILPLDTVEVSRSLRQTIKKQTFDIRVDTAFEEVVRNCAKRKETWISEDIIRAYTKLFKMGYAHSVEAWHNDKLVGGLYGVALGGAFFGESMFSTMRDASKVALVILVEHLKKKKFRLLDTQFITPHLSRFGAVNIPRDEYLLRLEKAISLPVRFSK